MCYRDVYIAERTMVLQASEAPRLAARQRLLREAGLVRPGWFLRQSCWLLCQLGHLMVAAGRRLEHGGQPRALPAGR
jgi:hypothetical protein